MMELRERIARAICGNWVVGDDRPWQQWTEEADAVLEVLNTWQPIATAPKDGTLILCAGEFCGPGDWVMKMGYWSEAEEGWCLFGGSWKPTHWMPLPAPPKTEERA